MNDVQLLYHMHGITQLLCHRLLVISIASHRLLSSDATGSLTTGVITTDRCSVCISKGQCERAYP